MKKAKNNTLHSMIGSTFGGTGSAIYGYGVYDFDNGNFSKGDAVKNDVRLPHDLTSDSRRLHELIVDKEADILCEALSGKVIPYHITDLK